MRSTARLKADTKTPVALTHLLGKNTGPSPTETSEAYQGANYTYGSINVLDNKFSNSPIRIQPKLTINQPGDEYEHEADAMADKVMRMPDDSSPEKATGQSAASALQRKCKHCEEEKKVQRKETSPATPSVERAAGYVSSLSGGRPLSGSERSFFEPRMGYDFSKVRLHTDSQANQSANSINAMAYTHGSNIVFGANQYQSEKAAGRRLLAHELAHVMQQDTMIGREFYIQRQTAPQTGLFSYPEEDRKRIQVQTDTVDMNGWPDLKFWFATSPKFVGGGALKSEAAKGEVIFNKDVSSTQTVLGFDVRRGLINIAGKLEFNNDILPLNKTITLFFDLTPFGGAKGNYRFTYFEHVENSNVKEVTLIEQLAPSILPQNVANNTVEATPGPFELRGKKFILVNDKTKAWTLEQKAFLNQALNMLSDTALNQIEGLTFARETDITSKLNDDKEGGSYHMDDHKVVIRDVAFSNFTNRYASGNEAIRMIIHELGHALDLAPLREARKTFDSSSHSQKAISDLKKVKSLSGSTTKVELKTDPEDKKKKKINTEVIEESKSTKFREAVLKDRSLKGIKLPNSITKYGDTTWVENFAEAFSIYMVDRELFRQLRPATFAYFEDMKF